MTQASAPLSVQILPIIRAALAEDLTLGDATTAPLLPAPVRARGIITAHQPMTVAGVAVARLVFAEVDRTVWTTRAVDDGSAVEPGSHVMVLEGDARSLLMAERVALNFLQRLSGIATLTARFCDSVRGYRTRILDTRKTTPGLRVLEKWAVRLGGGANHRSSLGDGILIKDNHLAVLRALGAGVAQACRLARERGPHGLRITVEVQSLGQVQEALDGGADVVLLDNMTPPLIRKAIALVKGRALVEVSGGITLQTAREAAAAGADFISIGALTHSAPAADLSMDLVPIERKSHGRRRR
ncbi:MAG: carboxylating nicotinate-nucleotide diphosphorylase [Nitrospirota bacterium]